MQQAALIVVATAADFDLAPAGAQAFRSSPRSSRSPGSSDGASSIGTKLTVLQGRFEPAGLSFQKSDLLQLLPFQDGQRLLQNSPYIQHWDRSGCR